MTIDQQVALDEALVPHASRLRIGKSNFRLRPDITSKESTLQVVYDVLRLTSFYKAFLVTADVPKIYMQEFWATATVHHHSIRFKMNNKKRIVNLEYFREMLHICPRIPNQTFDELLFEEEILAFLRYLRHNGEIKKITDVNINKLHQPWRSFAAVINKCLSGKSTVEYKYATKSNEMYYPRFTKVIINFFMTKALSIPRRNKHFGAMLPVELTNEDIRNSAAYKEYYAIASGAAPPKTKESLYMLSEVALTEAEQIKLATKRSLEQTHISQAIGSSADEGTDDDDDQSDADNDDDDQEDKDEQDDDDQDSDNDVENSDDESNDDESHGMNVRGDKRPDAEDDDEELYRDVNINLEGRDIQMTDVHTTQVLKDTHVTLTLVNPDGQQQSLSVSSQFVTSMFNPSPDAGIDYLLVSTPRVDVLVTTTVVPFLVTASTLPLPSIPIMSQVQQAPAPTPTTTPSTSLCKVAVQLQSDRLREEAKAENEDFFNKLDENIQKIIKEQVKEQVKVKVFKNLPKIEKTVNEQLEAKVLTRASNSSKTSYAVVDDLCKLELKKILIEKMESNKSIHQFNEQQNLYKALVDAYECNKIILDTYGDTVMLKKCHDDEDKDEEPSAGSDRGSKRRREDTLTPDLLAGPTYELMKGSCKSLVELEFFLEEVCKATTDQLDWNNPKGQQYPHNLLKPLPLVPNSRGRHVLPFDHFINNDLEYLRGGASSRKYKTFVTKTKALDYGHIKWIEELFYGFAINRESARDVYSKHRIIAVTELQIIEWHNYKHLDWITVRIDDDKLYKFKECDLKRLHIQDIEDIFFLLVQGMLTNRTIKERVASNVSLRMFTRSIVIQRRVEDL
nr:hypothetical protein [Tanacetum cinerariifolium]